MSVNLEHLGDIGEYLGDIGEYLGDIREYLGDIREYFGDIRDLWYSDFFHSVALLFLELLCITLKSGR